MTGKIKELQNEILFLEAKAEYLNKLNSLIEIKKVQKSDKINIIVELRKKYPLKILLEITNLKRSTYYFHLKKKDMDLKNEGIINKIKEIFYENKRRYGYRRITLELRKQGFIVNHKKVLRLMRKLNLQSILYKRNKKYSSYRGIIGKTPDNYIERNFEAERPNEKWFTDITEFKLKGEKLYLSVILDAYGRYVISYNISLHPNFFQVKEMLEKAFKNNPNVENLILHSDHGWQYQRKFYIKKLKEKNILQSMSRIGNVLDNGLIENFFGIMKSEMFYGQENNYKDIKELKTAIEKYIDYYNNKRIKLKLKGLTPAAYRSQSL